MNQLFRRLGSAGSDDLTFLISQAHQLKTGVMASCIFVELIIINSAIMMFFQGMRAEAAIWSISASLMVVVTFLYNRLAMRSGLTPENVMAFLRGHLIVTGMTGLLWGCHAIYIFDESSAFRVFVSTLIVFSITLGGMLPGAIYRPAFIVLATCCILPFAIYVVIVADWPFRSVGLGSFVYYAFGLATSARFEVDSKEAAGAAHTKKLMVDIANEKDVLQKIHEEKTRFLAATSHDLSQPLHAQGYFLHLLREKTSDPEILEIVDRIESSWRGQVEVLEGLVEINRLDSGSVIPDIQSCRLVPLFKGLASEFAAMTAAKDITLKTDVEDLKLDTDPVLFARILRNLISNAIKFSPHGGEVSLIAKYNDGTASISISDNGSGIPKAKQNAIFEEYVQLKKGRSEIGSGVGLGLAIVKRLTGLLGIELDLRSEMDQGTTFRLSVEASLSDLQEEGNKQPNPPSSTFARSPLVVLVDDEAIVLSAMGSLLSIWGCQVLSATSGAEACKLLGEMTAKPVLFIVDKQLGEGDDGLDLIETLRDEVNEDIPAILMSGDLRGSETLSLLKDVIFLKKPIEPTILKQTLSNVIAN